MGHETAKANILIVEGEGRHSVSLVKREYLFGRETAPNVDITIHSSIVSRIHGRFFFQEGEWYYQDLNSSNGTFVNERHIRMDEKPRRITEGTTLRIDDIRSQGRRHEEGVLIYFFYGNLEDKYDTCSLNIPEGTSIEIGRDPSCPIHLDTVTVARRQGVLVRENGKIYYRDHSKAGNAYLNGARIHNRVQIRRQDVLYIGNIKMIFIGSVVLYRKPQTGNYLTIRGLTRTVADSEKHGRKKTILNDVNVDIAEGKLVAILGTSGAGKTTFMNCVIGYEPPTSGSVSVDGMDLYREKKEIKNRIGYVPQEDLLRGGLSMERTLDYIGRLRLQKDVSREERHERIRSILDDLDLGVNLRSTPIRKLSGGQRKRVSIASELVSDPSLLFLDEPTSGLDPETETKLVFLLKKLAHERGKTLMVVTHTIRNILEFDQVLFFGPGGKLCYSGPPARAMGFFGVKDFVDIYSLVSGNPDYYATIQKKELVQQ